jgi:triacylglycerol lipase
MSVRRGIVFGAKIRKRSADDKAGYDRTAGSSERDRPAHVTPVVLHHGLFGFGHFAVGPVRLRYFAGGIERAIRDCGCPLVVARTHPTGGIGLRARQLKTSILQQLSAIEGCPRDGRVVVVAHSMGGLDARYMIAKLGMADRVAALVTISTPHRGSAYADWVMRNLAEKLRGAQLVRALGLDLQAVADLTTDSLARFNGEVPDHPAVRYFSISAARPAGKVAAIFAHSQAIVSRAEGENDGIVSVASAKWGEHLGTWPADHLHVINKRFTPEAMLPSGDITPRYVALLRLLRDRGVMSSAATAAA